MSKHTILRWIIINGGPGIDFKEQYGWPQIKVYGTFDRLEPVRTFLNGRIRQAATRKHTKGDNPYCWYPDDYSAVLDLYDMLGAAKSLGNRDIVPYIIKALNGIDNWRRINGKAYPDGPSWTQEPIRRRERLGL